MTATPVVVDDAVYTADAMGNVHALDAETGRIRWSYRTGASVGGSLAVTGETVYAASYDDHLYALDVSNGTSRWRVEVPDSRGGPVVAADQVVVGGTDGSLRAFDREGDAVWRVELDGYVFSSVAVNDGRAYVGTWNGSVYAIGTSEPTNAVSSPL